MKSTISFIQAPSPKPYSCTFFGRDKFYPELSPPLFQFRDYQLKEAKQHLDDFINRINKLAVFL